MEAETASRKNREKEKKEQAKAANYQPDNTTGEDLRAEIEHYAKVCEDIFNKYY